MPRATVVHDVVQLHRDRAGGFDLASVDRIRIKRRRRTVGQIVKVGYGLLHQFRERPENDGMVGLGQEVVTGDGLPAGVQTRTIVVKAHRPLVGNRFRRSVASQLLFRESQDFLAALVEHVAFCQQ